MKQEEIKKPKNYEEGGLTKMTKTLSENAIGVVFLISLLIWVISSLFVSIIDVFSGTFDHKVLSISFIVGIVTAGYMSVMKSIKDKKSGVPKPKKTSSCKKCGKNTTKK